MILFLSLFWGNKKGPWKGGPFPKALSRPLHLFYKGWGAYFAKGCHSGKFFFSGRAVHFRRLGGMPRFLGTQRS